MKFPRYTREENRSCKLTDAEIVEIRELRTSGMSYGEIARDFDMSPSGIYYWCMSDEARKEKNKKLYKNQLFIRPWGKRKEYRKRKLRLHPELYDYENEYYKKRFSGVIQPRNKEYWLKNKDKRTKSFKIYRLVHLDKFREYNKKSYLKNRDKRLAYKREKYRQKHPIKLLKPLTKKRKELGI